MPGLFLHVGATMQCPHQAPVTTTPVQTRVLVSGQPVAVTSNQIFVTGCPFTVGPKPQPCVTVRWMLTSTRVQVGGLPALLQPAPGTGQAMCQSAEQAPQGPPIVSSLQTRVTAQ